MAAKEDEFAKRRRERERAAERGEVDPDEGDSLSARRQRVERMDSGRQLDLTPEKLMETIQEIERTLDQLDNLYRQFRLGFEKHPPHARRKQLDQMMGAIAYVHKPTAQINFRYHALQSRYEAYAVRWDKLVAGIESGRIKRALVNR